ncbi:MAG: glyoxalase superfamily protein [Variovorax sp.]
MEIQQLKLLAGRIRGLLEQQGTHISHSQALDTSAALPGLRNWPEVVAFPDRVAACQLDLAATARLSYRLQAKGFGEMSAATLLGALKPPQGAEARPVVTEVWPGGAAPGVYVTTSQASIDALLHAYDDATDGAIVYAEEAGQHHEGSIDLGDQGISSPGLARVPSGTLIVVGPMELSQHAWDYNTSHLEWACMHAANSGHRVALLVETPSPSTLFHDLTVMIRSVQNEGEQLELMLLGAVSADGVLVAKEASTFSARVVHPIVVANTATVDAVPAVARQLLRDAIARKPRGLLILGSNMKQSHERVDSVCSALALTDHLGPVERIMARELSTPAKDWMVPEPLKALPMLPSIKSAYALGYRRMVIETIYTGAEDLAEYSDEVTFISGTYGFDAQEAFSNFELTFGSSREDALANVIAVMAVATLVEREGGELTDLFVPTHAVGGPDASPLDLIRDFRALRWEEQLDRALVDKRITLGQAKKAFNAGQGHRALQHLARKNTAQVRRPGQRP